MHSLRPVSGPTAEVVEALEAWLGRTDEPEPLVVETSGSTGRPKRVVLSRRALVASAGATARRLGAERRWLLALPVSYVAGLQVVVRSLLAGHRPVLGEDHETFDEAVDALGDDGLCSLVPTQLAHLLDDEEDLAALARFHTVLLGGGPVDPALRARAEASGVRVVATYGASETAGGCVYDGRPLDGVRVRIDDGPGGRGRILLGGPTLADGYLDDVTLTAETFDDGWYRTSDAGRWLDDGRLDVIGRLDDVVVSGGVNVPGPAVAARLRQHPGVREAEVVGVDDPEWGRRVVALVVPATRPPLKPPALEQLRDFVGATLPRAWAPREVRHVDALPLLDNGKVDRLALAALAGSGAEGEEGEA
ncbi:AMP-binding protein [uncultured Nocardioides sp.]|uniref:AMP-binding protein n=1 Tax=uncultured Nocardioides sp. TaxID=198441 RepID=UPI00260F605F|nr:AMP-binding protein [uncultured Nocardioides sp.]